MKRIWLEQVQKISPPLHTSDTQKERRRGAEEKLGEVQKINQEAIWQSQDSGDTNTTTDASAVLPPRQLCIAWRGATSHRSLMQRDL